jgi:hypothetical protein
MLHVEIIGILGSILVLMAMTVKSSTTKGNLMMRIINIIGSVIFVVYGFMISAYSTAFMNIAATFVNGFFIFKLCSNLSKE